MGADFTLIVSKTGKLYGCGTNEFGQLGLGRMTSSTNSATEIPGLSKVQYVEAGYDFSYAMTADNNIYNMGQNTYGA